MEQSVADPGFPIGEGVDPLGGHGPPTWVLFGKMYVKTKEFGPVGGRAPGTPPRSANDSGYQLVGKVDQIHLKF